MANCKNTQQLNITCGADVVLHDKLMFDGEVFDPNVSVDIECNLVNSLGKRTSLEYEIADEVLIIQIPWVDGRNAGCYGLEVKGKCNGKTWATYADSLIRYTRATVEGAAVVEAESDWYDVTQIVSYRYSDSPLDEVDATIDDNYGEPTVTPTYEHNKLTLDFKNLRGNGIESVEQTTVSTEDEGINETTITQDNGNTTVIQVRNGRKGTKGDKGDTGDSAIFDPTTGNISQMKQTTGDDELSPMSQKAVTKEIDKLNADISNVPLLSEDNLINRGDAILITNYYIKENGVSYTQASSPKIGCFFNVLKNDKVYITANNAATTHYALVKSLPPADLIYAQGESGRHIAAAGTSFTVDIPENCYLYLMGVDVSASTIIDHLPAAVKIERKNMIYPEDHNDEKTALFYGISNQYLTIILPTKRGDNIWMELGTNTDYLYYGEVSKNYNDCFAIGSDMLFDWTAVDTVTFTPNYSTGIPSRCFTSKNNGYVKIYVKRNDGNSLTDGDCAYIKSNLKVFIGSRELYAKEKGWKKLYIGDTFLQRTLSTAGIDSATNSKRVCMSYVMLVPCDNCQFQFMQPANFVNIFRFGKYNEGSPFDKYVSHVKNGQIVNVPDGYQYMILVFGVYIGSEGIDITPSYIQELVRSGEISLYYRGNSDYRNIIETNNTSETYIQALISPFAETPILNNNPDRDATFLHISDLHGDAFRYERAMQYAQYLNVDYVLVTGDMVMWKGEQGCGYIYDLAKKYNQKVFTCVGNHDSWGAYHTMSAMSQYVIMPCITAEDCTYDSDVQYPTYYFKDLTSDKIRLISVNQYDTNARNGASSNYYTQWQIDWLIAVLKSTPAEYGIIVIGHTPEAHINKVEGCEAFYQDDVYTESLGSNNVIPRIIDAFISRTTIDVDVTQKNWTSGQNETLAIEGDFSNVDSSVEFLFYAHGHAHSDRIGYVDGVENIILSANVCAGNANKKCTGPYIPCAQTDLPRRLKGITQDAFNLYSVDRVNGNIRVARIGSNFTQGLKDRKCMVIPYKTTI